MENITMKFLALYLCAFTLYAHASNMNMSIKEENELNSSLSVTAEPIWQVQNRIIKEGLKSEQILIEARDNKTNALEMGLINAVKADVTKIAPILSQLHFENKSKIETKIREYGKILSQKSSQRNSSLTPNEKFLLNNKIEAAEISIRELQKKMAFEQCSLSFWKELTTFVPALFDCIEIIVNTEIGRSIQVREECRYSYGYPINLYQTPPEEDKITYKVFYFSNQEAEFKKSLERMSGETLAALKEKDIDVLSLYKEFQQQYNFLPLFRYLTHNINASFNASFVGSSYFPVIRFEENPLTDPMLRHLTELLPTIEGIISHEDKINWAIVSIDRDEKFAHTIDSLKNILCHAVALQIESLQNLKK